MVGGDTAAWVRSDDGSNIVAGDVKKGREILDIWFVKLNDFVRARMKYDRYSRGLSVSDIEDNILSYISMVTDTELFDNSKNPPPPHPHPTPGLLTTMDTYPTQPTIPLL